jgi:hypothetical protein
MHLQHIATANTVPMVSHVSAAGWFPRIAVRLRIFTPPPRWGSCAADAMRRVRGNFTGYIVSEPHSEPRPLVTASFPVSAHHFCSGRRVWAVDGGAPRDAKWRDPRDSSHCATLAARNAWPTPQLDMVRDAPARRAPVRRGRRRGADADARSGPGPDLVSTSAARGCPRRAGGGRGQKKTMRFACANRRIIPFEEKCSSRGRYLGRRTRR